MTLVELENQINIMLNHFRVPSRKFVALKGISTHFIVEDFGLLVCCINRVDYTQVSNDTADQFQGWRIIYVTTSDSIREVRFKILWSLMRGGYMKWLRNHFPRQVHNIINGPENLGRRIIEERLRIWADRPKYKFLIEDNKAVLNSNFSRELIDNPGFFDEMPED
jgi:hypothetical protein